MPDSQLALKKPHEETKADRFVYFTVLIALVLKLTQGFMFLLTPTQGENKAWQVASVTIDGLQVLVTMVYNFLPTSQMTRKGIMGCFIALQAQSLVSIQIMPNRYDVVVLVSFQQLFLNFIRDQRTKVLVTFLCLPINIYVLIILSNSTDLVIPTILYQISRDLPWLKRVNSLRKCTVNMRESIKNASPRLLSYSTPNSRSVANPVSKMQQEDYIASDSMPSAKLRNKLGHHLDRQFSYAESYCKMNTQDWQEKLELFPIGIVVIEGNNRVKYMNTFVKQFFFGNEQAINQTAYHLMETIEFKIICPRRQKPKYSVKQTDSLSQDSQFGNQKMRKSDTQIEDKAREPMILSRILDLYRAGVLQSMVDNNRLELQGTFGECQPLFNIDETATLAVNVHPYDESKMNFLLVLSDITKQNKLIQLEVKEEFKNKVSKLLFSKVIHSFSHELRTPLNGAVIHLEAFVSEPNISESQKNQYILPSLNSLKLQSFIINDIIDFCEMNSEMLQIKISEFSIHRLLADLQSMFQSIITSKNLTLQLLIGEGIPENILNDPQRISQILVNIIQNSVKFSSNGVIQLKVEHGVKGFLQFSVIDKGTGIHNDQLIGIDPKKLNKVKKTLQSIDGDTHVHQNWEGFGLLISQMILFHLNNNLNQRIQIFSEGETKGTMVQFSIKNFPLISESLKSLDNPLKFPYRPTQRRRQTLPGKTHGLHTHKVEKLWEKAQTQTIQVPSKYKSQQLLDQQFDLDSIEGDEGEKKKQTGNLEVKMLQDIDFKQSDICKCKRIMSVDDEPFNHQSMKLILGNLGFEVVCCFDGKESIEYFKDIQSKHRKCGKQCRYFRLILMDYQMPILDGCQATQALVNMMQKRSIPMIPIIGLTAFSSSQDRDRCINSGMKEVLAKPLRIARLKSLLSDLKL